MKNNRIFFLDLENVPNELSNLNLLTEKDKIVVFYNESDIILKNKVLQELCTNSLNANIEIRTFKQRTKNALDFTLISCIPMMCMNSTPQEIYIISKDKGFQSAIDCFRYYELDVKQIHSVRELREEKAEEQAVTRDKISKAIQSAGHIATKKQIKFCEKLIQNSSTKELFHNAIQEKFKTYNAASLYKELLPLFLETKNVPAHAN